MQQYKPQKGENETIMIGHSHNQKQGSNLTAALNSILQVTNSALQSIRNHVLCKVLGSSRGQEKAMEKERNLGLGFRVPWHSLFGKSVKWVSKKPIHESISHSLESQFQDDHNFKYQFIQTESILNMD